VRREDPADRRLQDPALAAALDGLSAARARLDLEDVVLLVQSPFWAPLAAALRARFGWRIVYDCLDAHEGFSTNRAGIFEEAERAAASDASRRRDVRDPPAPDGGLKPRCASSAQRLRLRAVRFLTRAAGSAGSRSATRAPWTPG
jgi:hypothetical protein